MASYTPLTAEDRTAAFAVIRDMQDYSDLRLVREYRDNVIADEQGSVFAMTLQPWFESELMTRLGRARED